MTSSISRRLPLSLLLAAGLGLSAASGLSAAPIKPAEAAEELEPSDSGPAAGPAAPVDTVSASSAPAVSVPAAADSASGTAEPAPAVGGPAAVGEAPAADSGAAPAASAVPAVPAVPAAVLPAEAAEGPGDLTIEVDESRSRNEGKSLPLAMLFSAVLPGTGELYLQEKDKAKTFLLVEAGFWAALYVSFVAKESYLQSARNHASQYAGIDAGSKDEDFLETMGTFRSYLEKQHRQDSYELAQVLQNRRDGDYDIKPVPENYWDFGSSANPQNTRNWREFQSTLRYYRASKVAMSFALGALAMNRLASMVNTLQTYKRTSASTAARWDITPDLGPGYAGTLLTLRF